MLLTGTYARMLPHPTRRAPARDQRSSPAERLDTIDEGIVALFPLSSLTRSITHLLGVVGSHPRQVHCGQVAEGLQRAGREGAVVSGGDEEMGEREGVLEAAVECGEGVSDTFLFDQVVMLTECSSTMQTVHQGL